MRQILVKLLYILLSDYQRKEVIFQREIPLIIAEAIHVACAGDKFISEIAEFEAFLQEAVPVHFGFTFGVEFSQYSAVFAQYVVDIARKIDGVAV